MPDWTWILVVVGVLALAVVVARTVIALSPRDESAMAATAAHGDGEVAPGKNASGTDNSDKDASGKDNSDTAA